MSEQPTQQPKTENWAEKTIRDVLLETHREQRRNRFWRNLWRVVWLLSFIWMISFAWSDDKKALINVDHQQKHTAVIDLTGEIGGNDYIDQVKMLRDGLEAVYHNGNAKAIIIRANSPGGSPVVSNIAYQEIRRAKSEHPDTPIYVVAEDLCASGCYYIASAADKIYADPSSLVGSIGVIGSSFDVTGLMDKLGVKRRVRIAGNNKGMGDPFAPETPEQEAIWQEALEQIHVEFIHAVRQGRQGKLQEKQYPDLFSGRVFTGVEAKKAGLIDDLGNVYSVSREIGAPVLVNYTSQEDELTELLNRHFGAKMAQKIQEILNHSFF